MFKFRVPTWTFRTVTNLRFATRTTKVTSNLETVTLSYNHHQPRVRTEQLSTRTIRLWIQSRTIPVPNGDQEKGWWPPCQYSPHSSRASRWVRQGRDHRDWPPGRAGPPSPGRLLRGQSLALAEDCLRAAWSFMSSAAVLLSAAPQGQGNCFFLVVLSFGPVFERKLRAAACHID